MERGYQWWACFTSDIHPVPIGTLILFQTTHTFTLNCIQKLLCLIKERNHVLFILIQRKKIKQRRYARSKEMLMRATLPPSHLENKPNYDASVV